MEGIRELALCLAKQLSATSNSSDFTVEVRNNRDIDISKPEAEFEVRREVYYPMLIASDVMQNDFDESKVTLLAQASKLALEKAKSLGWLDGPEQKRKKKAAQAGFRAISGEPPQKGRRSASFLPANARVAGSVSARQPAAALRLGAVACPALCSARRPCC
jgi:hypothetical protein